MKIVATIQIYSKNLLTEYASKIKEYHNQIIPNVLTPNEQLIMDIGKTEYTVGEMVSAIWRSGVV